MLMDRKHLHNLGDSDIIQILEKWIIKCCKWRVEMLKLFHGSPEGIVGEIEPRSENICDFGTGFYTASHIDYAMSNIVIDEKGGNGYLYTLNVDTDGLNIYSFDEDFEFWMLYTAYNRGNIHKIKNYRGLKENHRRGGRGKEDGRRNGRLSLCQSGR